MRGWRKTIWRKGKSGKGEEIEDSIMTVTEKEKALFEKPLKRRGFSLFWLLASLAFLMLLGRVFYLAHFEGERYRDISQNNRIRKVVIKPPRGKILDKFGRVLAKNVPSVDVTMIPADIPKEKAEREREIEEIARIINIEAGNIELMLEQEKENSLNPVLIKENVSQEEALVLAGKVGRFPGLVLEKSAIRDYENGYIFSHILGYDGKITWQEIRDNPDYLMTDYIGKTGIEKAYESFLRGKKGYRQVEVDSSGNVKKHLGDIDPVPGDDLVLNIDEELQKKIYDVLSSVLEKTGTRTAAAVAIDPRDGGILAMVSLPSFNNNLFARGISNEEYRSLSEDTELPLFNRATRGEYPPGSTIKPAIAAGALSEGVINAETVIDGLGGALHIGAFRFGDWKVHGPSNVVQAIAESNDIFFYTIGGGYGSITGLGMEKMKKYYNLFGFGEKTGIDLPGEATGFIPDESWKEKKIGERWYIGNSYHASIGQGYVTATPLQLASYVAAIANKGTLFSPRVVSKIIESGGGEISVDSPVIRRNFLSSEVMETIRKGMRETVENGTAQSLKTLSIEVGGKTGTAEYGVEKGHTHAWFISFAPYDNPEIAMVVLAEGAGEGNSSPVPVTREVYDWYFSRQK